MKYFILFVFILVSNISICQQVNPDQFFYDYQTLSVNTFDIFQKAKSPSRNEVNISIGKWELILNPSEIISPNYRSVDQQGRDLSSFQNRPIPMNGKTKEGGEVSLTIGQGFVFGFVKDNKETFYIEPARYYQDTRNEDAVIIYNTKNIKEGSPRTCGYIDVQKKVKEHHENHQLRENLCYDIQYAICNDWSIVNQYGVAGAEARAIGITNDINANYDNEFGDELRFIISGQYNSTCSSCDPSQWTNTTDPGVLLPNFANWSKNNLASAPISIPHDVASLWTRRDFDGSTVGLAYVGVVCSFSYRYNVLQDIVDNGYRLRVLTAHELGHNLDADHDSSGSPNIMAPAINQTSSWSSLSIGSVDSYVSSSSASCLAICSDYPATAYFDNSAQNVSENNSGSSGGPCSEPYTDYLINVNLTKLPSSNLVVGVTVDNNSNASLSYDYELITPSLTFTPSGDLTENIVVRVYDDKAEEADETLILDININSGPGNVTSANEYILTIESNNDEVSQTCCAGSDFFFGESANYYLISGIFHGDYEDSKTRVLLSAAQLSSYGLTAGPIYGLDVYVSEKTSTGSYNNFTIGYKLINNTSLNGVPWQTTTQIYSQNVTTTGSSWNGFTFNSPIIWDGTSSIYLDFCFDNSSIIGRDRILAYLPGAAQSEFISYARTNSENGCTMNISSYSLYYNYTPIFLLRSSGGAVVETDVSSVSNGRIRSGEIAHMYSGAGEIIASIKNLGATDMNCTNATVSTAGNAKSTLGFGNFEYADKTFNIESENNSIYELTLYFTQAELQTWGTEKLDLNFIKSSGPISGANEGNSQIIFSKSAVENIGIGNNIAYTSIVNGSGSFALTDGYDASVAATFGDSDMLVDELNKGILMKNLSGDQYLVTVDVNGNIQAALNNSLSPSSYLTEGDLCIGEMSKALCLSRSVGQFTEIKVDNNGDILSINTTSMPPDAVHVDEGHFGLIMNGSGIIFRNSLNVCWKLYIDEAGAISTSEVPCIP